MNENHPDFMGPRRPTFIDMVRQLGYLPKADSSRPVGAPPPGFLGPPWPHNPKPAGVRAIERSKWANVIPLASVDGELAGPGVVEAADAAITRMLTGKLPEDAGANTAVASFLFTMLYEQRRHGTRADSARLIRKGVTYTVAPYRLGLHEVRQCNAASKKH